MRLSEKLMMLDACNKNENGGYVKENILKARFQADSLIAQRAMHNKSDFILAEDSDFAALLGRHCMMIKDVKKRNGVKSRGRKKSDLNNSIIGGSLPLHDASNFEVHLVGAGNERMRDLKKKIGEDDKRVNWDEAKYDLFGNISPTLRAMIALILGCDVYKEGVHSYGPAKVWKMLEKLKSENSKEKQTKQCLLDGLKLPEAVIDTLITAFLFEPGLVDSEEGETVRELSASSSPYIFNPPPPTFPKYLASFAGRDATIIDGPDLCKCSGSTKAGKEHFYLACEGSYSCTSCNNTFCKSCSYIPKFDRKEIKKQKEKNTPTEGRKKYKIYYQDCDDILCLDCFRLNRLGSRGTASSIHNPDDIVDKSLEEMIREMNEKFRMQIDSSASVAETTDIYNTYISSPDNIWNHHLNLIREKVKFPVLPANLLNDNNDSDIIKMQKIGRPFYFSDGGRFISDPELVSNEMIPSVLSLFSSILEHNEKKMVHQSDSDIGEYTHLPTMLLNFAYHSRVDSGYRLLNRCARHSCDPKTPSFIDASAGFFKKENGKYSKQIFNTLDSLYFQILISFYFIL
jgi:hypothetical protein